MFIRSQTTRLALVVAGLLIAGEPLRAQAPDAVAGPFPAAHAHNDYEHARPLADALAWGFCSVEADVYPVDGDLLVAHDRSDLKPERTLQSLYLAPLLARLENEGRVQPGTDTFTLLVDIKTDGEVAYELLKRQLEPLRPFLQSANGTAPLQVIISGDRPFTAISNHTDRLVGIDGRLEDLDRDDRPAALVPLISDRWGKRFRWFGASDMPDDERALLQELVRQAHARGQRLRFWATPEDPLVWRELAAAGVDLIGTDDLAALAGFLDARQTLE